MQNKTTPKQRFEKASKTVKQFLGAFEGVQYTLVLKAFGEVLRKLEDFTPEDIERGWLREIRKEIEKLPKFENETTRLFNKGAGPKVARKQRTLNRG